MDSRSAGDPPAPQEQLRVRGPLPGRKGPRPGHRGRESGSPPGIHGPHGSEPAGESLQRRGQSGPASLSPYDVAAEDARIRRRCMSRGPGYEPLWTSRWVLCRRTSTTPRHQSGEVCSSRWVWRHDGCVVRRRCRHADRSPGGCWTGVLTVRTRHDRRRQHIQSTLLLRERLVLSWRTGKGQRLAPRRREGWSRGGISSAVSSGKLHVRVLPRASVAESHLLVDGGFCMPKSRTGLRP